MVHDNRLRLLEVSRAHLEMFARTTEQNGRMRSTVACGRCAGSTATATSNDSWPGIQPPNVRRSKVDPASRTLGLDRDELGAVLVHAASGHPEITPSPRCWLMNGLRISEALGANIDDLDVERGHRTLRVVRKGGKHAIIPLASRTGRALDRYISDGPPGRSSSAPPGRGWTVRRRPDRETAGPSSGITKRI